MASAVNNDVARTAGLIAVAVLPAVAGITGDAYLDAGVFSQGFHTASLIAGALCVLAGGIAALTIQNPHPTVVTKTRPTLHCGLDAPPAHAGTPTHS
jgi:hypothetical protein